MTSIYFSTIYYIDMNVGLIIALFLPLTTIKSAAINLNNSDDGFFSYISTKGLSVKHISGSKYRITHLPWNCDIDTSTAKSFRKRNLSWRDMFETRIDVLRQKTVFSSEILRERMGALPEDGAPVTIVARQGDVTLPRENVIIRLNNHGPLNARTTMIMTWPMHVRTLIMCAREHSNEEIVPWTHHEPYGVGQNNGLFNTSRPLVIPEELWSSENLTYYRGPLYFMKGGYFFGHMAKCSPYDGIGLGALNRVAHLKGEISTLGFSTGADEYNLEYVNRFRLLAHKLAWSYFVVKELTDALLT